MFLSFRHLLLFAPINTLTSIYSTVLFPLSKPMGKWRLADNLGSF
jgi:hypothetical protein